MRAVIAAIFGADRLWRGLWIVAALAITVLYFLAEAAPPSGGNVDKILHLSAFASIGFPLRFATRSARKFRYLTSITLLYAPLLELGHLLMPARSFSLFDMAANIIGVAIGIALATAVASVIACMACMRGTPHGNFTRPD